jgi:hypothetical protein
MNNVDHNDIFAARRDSVRNFIPPDIAEASLRLGRRALAWGLIYLMVPLGVADLFAQDAPPPPPPDYQGQQQGAPAPAYSALSPDQINQLVAPIALYPDSLVAQILAASTFPNEIADADAFVQSQPGVPPDQLGQQVNGMNWDPSVKALIAFPTVLANLNKNINWTTQLGNAYYNQPQDVMAAVQVMRQRAYEAGNLKSNQQLAVTYQPNNIVIAPANPTVVYVPYYNPTVVYGAPVAYWGGYYPPPPPPGYAFAAGLAIGFGVGIAVASWNHWGWGWNNWGCGWGSHSTVVYNRNVYVSRSVTVINHGYYGGYDRNMAARTYNANLVRTAPNYRPGYNGTYANSAAYHNSYNRTVTNNFNRNVNVNNVNRNVNVNNVNRNTNVNNVNRNNNTNNYNRPTNTNNYNRPTPNNTNNYNRPTQPNNNNNNRPAYSTGNANNRPANTNNNNRPAQPNNNYSRPTNTNNSNRPTPNTTNNYSRPSNTNNTYHPPNNNNNRPAPQSRPAPQNKPEPQSKPSGGRPNGGHPNGEGGHPHGR